MVTNGKLPKAATTMRTLVAVTLLIMFVSWNWLVRDTPAVYHAPEIRPLDQKIKDFHLAWLRQRQHRVDWRGLIKPCVGQMEWGQVAPGWGRQNRSNATASTISYWDIRPAGEFSRFFIQSRTSDGGAKTIGGDWWRVYLRGPSSLAATVFDHRNGSYEALFLIMEPGVYDIHIYLDYSLCDGLKDPPRNWFIVGDAQGSYQKDNVLGKRDDYLLQIFNANAHLNIAIPPRNLPYTTEEILQSLNFPCEEHCRFLWDGFGRWVGNEWKPYLEQSTTWNTSAVTSPSGTFWTYGDSLAVRFAGQVSSKPLCRRLYAQCRVSHNWMYPIDRRGRDYHKKADDNLDFDRPRVVNAIRNVLKRTSMKTPKSTLFLNLGLHHAKRVNFTTFQAVLYDIVELLKERDAESSASSEELRYKAQLVWKTTTALHKEKASDLQMTHMRFLTSQRVHLFSSYSLTAMCQAGHQVVDVYPLTDSAPRGSLDVVHYADFVFGAVEKLLEKQKAEPQGMLDDMKKTKIRTCVAWDTYYD